jgi:hypothetical protein
MSWFGTYSGQSPEHIGRRSFEMWIEWFDFNRGQQNNSSIRAAPAASQLCETKARWIKCNVI